MAAAPRYKIYDSRDRYQAATHELEAAAALMAFYGDGATIRWDHPRKCIVWTEGSEDQPAAESYDHVFEVAHARIQEQLGARA